LGHPKWLGAQKSGLEEIPVHVADNLTPEQVRGYRLMDKLPPAIRLGSLNTAELTGLRLRSRQRGRPRKIEGPTH
jgi:hypothetical protein